MPLIHASMGKSILFYLKRGIWQVPSFLEFGTIELVPKTKYSI
jgi:hypothetical protein